MTVLQTLRNSINATGIKEVARRTGLAASTVSRINAGLVSPSLEVAEKISNAIGYEISIHPLRQLKYFPRLQEVLKELRQMKVQLRDLGVQHVTVFGSMARGEDHSGSDIDLYVDYGANSLNANQILRAEGKILDAFPGSKVDFVTNLSTPKGRRLKIQIRKDGRRAF